MEVKSFFRHSIIFLGVKKENSDYKPRFSLELKKKQATFKAGNHKIDHFYVTFSKIRREQYCYFDKTINFGIK